jgi:hypothetical protein
MLVNVDNDTLGRVLDNPEAMALDVLNDIIPAV